MRTLRLAMRGIPIRRGSFKKTHDNLARDVANVDRRCSTPPARHSARTSPAQSARRIPGGAPADS